MGSLNTVYPHVFMYPDNLAISTLCVIYIYLPWTSAIVIQRYPGPASALGVQTTEEEVQGFFDQHSCAWNGRQEERGERGL